MSSENLSHVNQRGEANMVDVGDKAISQRTARAEGAIYMAQSTLAAVSANQVAKGEVLAVARIAGIQAAKRCAELIPLCHPLALSKVEVTFSFAQDHIRVEAVCKVSAQTGVEMEALCAVSTAALTIYDMCKALDRGMRIEGIRLLEKHGGQSGSWQAQPES